MTDFDEFCFVEDLEEVHDTEETLQATEDERTQARREALIQEKERLRQQIANLQMGSSLTVGDADTDDEEGAHLQALVDAEKAKNAALRADLGVDHEPESSAGSSAGKLAALSPSLKELRMKAEAVKKGLDLCFLMDCTGSMEPCIEQVKTKLGHITDEVLKAHPGAFVRVAFVGYRDYEAQNPGIKTMLVHEFVSASDLHILRAYINPIQAMGGGDGAEDVAGGLQAANNLNWSSSTRLIIHFADYPGHGRFMHDLAHSPLDDYPEEDPGGVRFTELMHGLASKRVDFYFAGILVQTGRMAHLMSECYAYSHNASFKKMEWRSAAESFVPVVLESVRSSMQQSATYKHAQNAVENRLSSGSGAAKKSIFHSAVG